MHLMKFLSVLALAPLAIAMPSSQGLSMVRDDNTHDGHKGHHAGRHGCPDKLQECNDNCRRHNYSRGVCSSLKKSDGKAKYCFCE